MESINKRISISQLFERMRYEQDNYRPNPSYTQPGLKTLIHYRRDEKEKFPNGIVLQTMRKQFNTSMVPVPLKTFATSNCGLPGIYVSDSYILDTENYSQEFLDFFFNTDNRVVLDKLMYWVRPCSHIMLVFSPDIGDKHPNRQVLRTFDYTYELTQVSSQVYIGIRKDVSLGPMFKDVGFFHAIV